MMEYRNRWRGALLIGAPGIGKGTQAKKLVSDSGYIHIESSKLLQEYMRDNPNETRSEPLHAMFDQSGALKTAKLFDDILHFSVVQDRLTMMEISGRYKPSEQFAIWDGLIRTPEQAAMFDNILDVPICVYFDESLVPESELKKHWEERNRPGETWEMFLERQQIFGSKSKGLCEYYSKTGRLVMLNPAGTKDEVFERFLPIMEQYRL